MQTRGQRGGRIRDDGGGKITASVNSFRRSARLRERANTASDNKSSNSTSAVNKKKRSKRSISSFSLNPSRSVRTKSSANDAVNFGTKEEENLPSLRRLRGRTVPLLSPSPASSVTRSRTAAAKRVTPVPDSDSDYMVQEEGEHAVNTDDGYETNEDGEESYAADDDEGELEEENGETFYSESSSASFFLLSSELSSSSGENQDLGDMIHGRKPKAKNRLAQQRQASAGLEEKLRSGMCRIRSDENEDDSDVCEEEEKEGSEGGLRKERKSPRLQRKRRVGSCVKDKEEENVSEEDKGVWKSPLFLPQNRRSGCDNEKEHYDASEEDEEEEGKEEEEERRDEEEEDETVKGNNSSCRGRGCPYSLRYQRRLLREQKIGRLKEEGASEKRRKSLRLQHQWHEGRWMNEKEECSEGGLSKRRKSPRLQRKRRVNSWVKDKEQEADSEEDKRVRKSLRLRRLKRRCGRDNEKEHYDASEEDHVEEEGGKKERREEDENYTEEGHKSSDKVMICPYSLRHQRRLLREQIGRLSNEEGVREQGIKSSDEVSIKKKKSPSLHLKRRVCSWVKDKEQDEDSEGDKGVRRSVRFLRQKRRSCCDNEKEPYDASEDEEDERREEQGEDEYNTEEGNMSSDKGRSCPYSLRHQHRLLREEQIDRLSDEGAREKRRKSSFLHQGRWMNEKEDDSEEERNREIRKSPRLRRKRRRKDSAGENSSDASKEKEEDAEEDEKNNRRNRPYALRPPRMDSGVDGTYDDEDYSDDDDDDDDEECDAPRSKEKGEKDGIANNMVVEERREDADNKHHYSVASFVLSQDERGLFDDDSWEMEHEKNNESPSGISSRKKSRKLVAAEDDESYKPFSSEDSTTSSSSNDNNSYNSVDEEEKGCMNNDEEPDFSVYEDSSNSSCVDENGVDTDDISEFPAPPLRRKRLCASTEDAITFEPLQPEPFHVCWVAKKKKRQDLRHSCNKDYDEDDTQADDNNQNDEDVDRHCYSIHTLRTIALSKKGVFLQPPHFRCPMDSDLQEQILRKFGADALDLDRDFDFGNKDGESAEDDNWRGYKRGSMSSTDGIGVYSTARFSVLFRDYMQSLMGSQDLYCCPICYVEAHRRLRSKPSLRTEVADEDDNRFGYEGEGGSGDLDFATCVIDPMNVLSECGLFEEEEMVQEFHVAATFCFRKLLDVKQHLKDAHGVDCHVLDGNALFHRFQIRTSDGLLQRFLERRTQNVFQGDMRAYWNSGHNADMLYLLHLVKYRNNIGPSAWNFSLDISRSDVERLWDRLSEPYQKEKPGEIDDFIVDEKEDVDVEDKVDDEAEGKNKGSVEQEVHPIVQMTRFLRSMRVKLKDRMKREREQPYSVFSSSDDEYHRHDRTGCSDSDSKSVEGRRDDDEEDGGEQISNENDENEIVIGCPRQKFPAANKYGAFRGEKTSEEEWEAERRIRPKQRRRRQQEQGCRRRRMLRWRQFKNIESSSSSSEDFVVSTNNRPTMMGCKTSLYNDTEGGEDNSHDKISFLLSPRHRISVGLDDDSGDDN